MEALEVDVVASFDASLFAELNSLLDRVAADGGRSGLSDDRLRALDLAGRGGSAGPMTCVTARDRSGHLVGWGQVDGGGSGRTPSLEVVVLPDRGPVVDRILDTALAAHRAAGGGPLRWWVSHASHSDDVRAAAHGLATERELLQLRCPLPLPARTSDRLRTPVATRAFVPGRDEAAWLVQNNRAFAGHPEQGRWDLPTLEEREAEPWFDPDGFRLLEVDGRIAGSCWTKVHASHHPPLGEIYVIGVDPDFHGNGWGRALAEDGFAWLAAHGLDHGMLYVDATNEPAVGLYASMGMTTHHVDRAYIIRPG